MTDAKSLAIKAFEHATGNVVRNPADYGAALRLTEKIVRYTLECEEVRELIEVISEMLVLLEDMQTGDYVPDSFTAQPMERALKAFDTLAGGEK